MGKTLTPLDQLIELRESRLSLLVKTLSHMDTERVSATQLFRYMNAHSASYRSRGWELFQADLDLLAEHDCLAITDGDVVMRSSVTYAGAES